jgi:hypothetical protein
MGLNLEYPPGATPLEPDDAAGLIPSHITTQGQLNEWEFQKNGVEPFDWGNADLVPPGDVRDRYISALRAADGRVYSRLFKFVRSGGGNI